MAVLNVLFKLKNTTLKLEMKMQVPASVLTFSSPKKFSSDHHVTALRIGGILLFQWKCKQMQRIVLVRGLYKKHVH